jgi:uncharacterized protein (DUF952 family)
MIIYHLAPAERWQNWPADTPYLPAEYEADGFVHCTAGEELLLAVANRYYRETPGAFVVVALAVERLDAPLRWEGGQPPDGSVANEDLAPLFPHLYGPINPGAVVEVWVARRGPDGTFVSREPSSS